MKARWPWRLGLLLVLLLGGGLGVIHHLVQNVIPGAVSSAVPKGEPALPAVAAPAPPAAAPEAAPPAPVSGVAAASAPGTATAGDPAPERPKAAAAPAPGPADPAADSDKPILVTTSRGRMVATGPILFNSGSAEIRATSLPVLNSLAELLQSMPEIHVAIQGHTDSLGEEAVNQRVSTDRAAAVLQYLVSRGINPARLTSMGLGSQNPIAANDTQLGRQANRRIEFHVVSP